VTDVSDANRQLAQTVLQAFGGEPPRVLRYLDAPEEHHVDIAVADDVPADGITSYSTLGLSDTPLVDQGREIDLRIELVGACRQEHDEFANVVSTAAFCIIKDHWFAYPGRIFPEIVGMYFPDAQVKHLLLVPPFLWDLETQRLPEKTVAWLQLVPITEAELRYARRQARIAGDEQALPKALERARIDVYDLRRPSVL
jgi:antitoxin YqcF